MARLAVAGNPAFEVSEIETRRPGPHYSVETLEAVARERPEDELFFLIGADSLVDLPHWREPGKILSWPSLVVANRPGFEPPPFDVPPDAKAIQRVTIPPIGIASQRDPPLADRRPVDPLPGPASGRSLHRRPRPLPAGDWIWR